MRILVINDIEEYQKIAKALSVDIRVRIYKLLQQKDYGINEIAEKLGVPLSTISFNIKKLEKVGLIRTKSVPAKKSGSQKICSLRYKEIIFSPFNEKLERYKTTLSIGQYDNFEVHPPCGIASDLKIIGKFDYIPSFYRAEKKEAQIIWFSKGYIEYHFPNEVPKDVLIKKLKFTAELCSEAKGYDLDYPSDITLWINDYEIGTWMSTADYGGKRGKFTPLWWNLKSTQYGEKISWIVSEEQTTINDTIISNTKILDLEIDKKPYIAIRIGIKKGAENQGGLNLFGEKFGNYNKDPTIEIIYEKQKDNKKIR